MHTNVQPEKEQAIATGESVFESGRDEEGIPFVITEKGTYPTIVKTKYVGDEIPEKFQGEFKEEGVEEKEKTEEPLFGELSPFKTGE